MVFENQCKPYVSVRLCDSILFLYTKPHNFNFSTFPQLMLCLNLHISSPPPPRILIFLLWGIFGKSKSGRWREGRGREKIGDIVFLATAMVQVMKYELSHFFSLHTSDLGRWPPLGEEDNLISIHVNFHFSAKRQQICFRFCGITYFALVI